MWANNNYVVDGVDLFVFSISAAAHAFWYGKSVLLNFINKSGSYMYVYAGSSIFCLMLTYFFAKNNYLIVILFFALLELLMIFLVNRIGKSVTWFIWLVYRSYFILWYLVAVGCSPHHLFCLYIYFWVFVFLWCWGGLVLMI